MALTVLTSPPPGPGLDPRARLELLLNILWGFLPRGPWLLLLPGKLYAPLGNFPSSPSLPIRSARPAFGWALAFPHLDTAGAQDALRLPTGPA